MGRGIALALTTLLLPGVAFAQSQGGDEGGDPEARVPRDSPPVAIAAPVSGAITVDGVLDEGGWGNAEALTRFVQRTPRDGAPATEESEVRVLYDAEALYVGVWAFDSNPSEMIQGERIRDYDLEQSDAVLLIFDTYQDRQNGFVFGTNPQAIEYDGQVANQGQGGGFFRGGPGQQRQQGGSGGGFNLNWDGSWTVATSRDGRGWYAEFRIPFSTLRYGPDEEQTWGFNVARRIRRHNEESFWSPVSREFSLFRVSEAGELRGLRPPPQRSVQVTPYLLGSTARDYAAGEQEFSEDGEIGGDAKVQITQGLTLDLTYNTDFAQVEVDEVQTNLTRFSLFFPEKRPFFLENAGFFSVGTGQAELFFSRRIGIGSDGSQVPIDGGGRLSGRALGMNVGLLHIRTDGLDNLGQGDAYSVVRLAKELPNRSRVGGIFVERDALGVSGDHNRTYALDGQLGLGSAWTLSSFVAKTETPELDGRERAINVELGLDSREWRGSAQFREIGEDFNPEVGFLPRDGYRYYQGFGMRIFRPETFAGIREIRPHVSYFTFRDIDTNFEETSRLHVDSHFEWHGGTFFSPAFNWVREGLEEPFEIADGVVIPPGTYDGWEAAWRFRTDQSAMLSFDGGYDWGSFFSGTRRGPLGTVTMRWGSRFSTSVRFERNNVDLDEGEFTTNLVGLRLGWFFTPRIFLQSLLQYSDQADTFSANIRFGWLGTAGTGLFVVYNDAQGVDDLSGPLSRTVTVKFSRQFDVLRW